MRRDDSQMMNCIIMTMFAGLIIGLTLGLLIGIAL